MIDEKYLKELIINKSGSVKNIFLKSEVLDLLNCRKVYYLKKNGFGRNTIYVRKNIVKWIYRLNIKVFRGNDAVRGGQLGNYIEIAEPNSAHIIDLKQKITALTGINFDKTKIKEIS